MAAADTETAFAKINLALHVRRRMADGYHAIETIFAFAQDGDRLTVSPADDVTLTLSGPFAAGLGGDNLVLRAAQALRNAAGVTAGAAVHLDKRLPVAAGIGGGSADAAAALRLLTRYWGLESMGSRPRVNDDIVAIATALGADVPACLLSQTCRGEGRGDRLEALTGLADMPLLLVNPRVACPTGPVFAAWDGMDRGPLEPGDPLDAALAGRNDLELPACALIPAIADAVALLAAQPGILIARMSGSGATCFALFADAAARDRADHAIGSARPDWWRLASALR